MKAALRRLVSIVFAGAALCATASAYYHFIHYASRNAPFVPIPEKFDLRSLPDRTLRYYISTDGPEKFADGDSFAAVLSQLRLVGSAWNDIDTSALRVVYGGMKLPDTADVTPHVNVLFSDELPPGVFATGGPTSRADVVTPDGGDPFVPITGAVLILKRDLSDRPSSSTGFFLTAVHELGHALGLQHTLTSSVMSADVTRASTRANVLGADDAAAISLLYPNSLFARRFGSISGKVTMSGSGVHLASVVALTAGGQAVSALTNPDGTFRIDGLRAMSYYVYAHPLPPSVQSDLGPAEVVLPLDPDGQPIAAGDPFRAQFYPGAHDYRDAHTVAVKVGETTPDIDFDVVKSAAPSLYGVTTYSFPAGITVKPAYMNLAQTEVPYMVAWGNGIMDGTKVAPGLSVATLGNAAAIAHGGVHPYSVDPSFLQVNFLFTPFSGTGPRHLIFSTPAELYVLPSALTLVNRKPPAIDSATAAADEDGNTVVTIAGSGLSAGTDILFDGIPAKILSVDAGAGTMRVVPPSAPAGYRAKIIALNNDGQTSLFTGSPVPYEYKTGLEPSPTISLSSTASRPGAEAMVEIAGTNMQFRPGQVWVGFGSSDIVVKDVWVVNPNLVRANVFVVPDAGPSDALVSVASGFQETAQAAGFHVRDSESILVSLNSDVVNAADGSPNVYPGATGILPVTNLPESATASSITLTLNNVAVPVVRVENGTIRFQVPETFKPGPAVVRLDTGADPIAPVFIEIAQAPPVIENVMAGDAPADSDHPAEAGSRLMIAISHAGDSGVTFTRDRLMVWIGGVRHAIPGPAEPLPGQPRLHAIYVTLLPAVAASDKVPVVVWLDGRPSSAFYITVQK